MEKFSHECTFKHHTSIVVLNVLVPEFSGKVFSKKEQALIYIWSFLNPQEG